MFDIKTFYWSVFNQCHHKFLAVSNQLVISLSV